MCEGEVAMCEGEVHASLVSRPAVLLCLVEPDIRMCMAGLETSVS